MPGAGPFKMFTHRRGIALVVSNFQLPLPEGERAHSQQEYKIRRTPQSGTGANNSHKHIQPHSHTHSRVRVFVVCVCVWYDVGV